MVKYFNENVVKIKQLQCDIMKLNWYNMVGIYGNKLKS